MDKKPNTKSSAFKSQGMVGQGTRVYRDRKTSIPPKPDAVGKNVSPAFTCVDCVLRQQCPDAL
jgi:hypothetical protein